MTKIRPFREAIKKDLVTITRSYGVPGGIRTHDPQRRRLILYPTELRVHLFSRL